MKRSELFLVAPLIGVLTGLGALLLDEALTVLTGSHPIPWTVKILAIYALWGAAAGLLAGFLLRRRPSRAATAALSLALLYVPPVWERLINTLNGWQATAAVAVATAGYGVWILVLGRVLGGDAPDLAKKPAAFLLAALTVALGLAVNRNLVTYPLELLALVADAVTVLAVLGLALLVRAFGRRVLVAAAILLLAADAGLLYHSMPSPPDERRLRQPDVLLVVVDTLRFDVFRSVLETSEEGRAFRDAMDPAVYFENAVAAAPWTVPSVASIMTGLFPQEHGVHGKPPSTRDWSRPLTRLPDPIPTLAQHLREAGYRTEAITANPFLVPGSGIYRGFDRHTLLKGASAKLPLVTVLARAGLVESDLYVGAPMVHRRLRQRIGDLSRGREPVFLWLHLMDPHLPLYAHPDLAPDPAGRDLAGDQRLYRDETRFALREVRRMIALLDTYGLWRNALVLVVADHGEMFPSDGHSVEIPGKGRVDNGHGHALYSELVRVPLIVRPPGGAARSRWEDALVSHVDLRETVVDVLGLPVPRFPGRVSLAPLLRGETAEPGEDRRAVLVGGIQHGPPQRALRTRDFKLIHFPNGEHSDELYDVRADPHERHNASGERPAALRQQLALLDELWGRLAEAPEGDSIELDEETRERLKALGYLQ